MVPGYPDRYVSLFARRGQRAAVIKGAIFRPYSNMVVPFGPAEADFSLSRSDAAAALSLLGGVLVRTTAGFAPPGPRSDWYAVVCRRFRELEDVPSPNTRSKLRRGRRNCEVRPVGPEELS